MYVHGCNYLQKSYHSYSITTLTDIPGTGSAPSSGKIVMSYCTYTCRENRSSLPTRVYILYKYGKWGEILSIQCMWSVSRSTKHFDPEPSSVVQYRSCSVWYNWKRTLKCLIDLETVYYTCTQEFAPFTMYVHSYISIVPLLFSNIYTGTVLYTIKCVSLGRC